MKSLIVLMLIMVWHISRSCGQVSAADRIKLYKSKIYGTTKSTTSKGILYETYDSTISLINMHSYKHQYKDQIRINSKALIMTESDLIIVPTQDIQWIIIRRKGNVWKATVIGAVIGCTIGYSFMRIAGSEGGVYSPSGDQLSLPFGAICLIPGALVGATVGCAISIRIPISGSQLKYSKARPRLDKYKYTGN